MMKTWLITGCSGGFGKLLAHAALARGDNVVVSARDPGTLSKFVAQYPKTARAIAFSVSPVESETRWIWK